MNTILTIIRKELTDSLRDRKTLISAVILPALAVPLLILGVTRLQKSLTEKERGRELKIAIFNAPSAVEQAFSDPKIRLIKTSTLAAARDSVAKEKYDAVLDFDQNFGTSVDSLHSGKLNLYYKSTTELVEKRVTEKLEQYKAGIMSARFTRLGLSPEMLNPVAVNKVDLASTKEQIGVLLGGFIPYFFILFCFLGCVYPAIDLTTGEKEKGTLETLLTVPASRLHILIGKMVTIAIIGVCAALMTIGGMFAAIRLSSEIPAEILQTVNDILSLRFIVMLFAMLIPLSLFFAGLLSTIAIRASTFKEAQSYVTPLTFVVIIPAMIALMPGVKLSWQTAWIPILNIALATKEIIAGKINNLQYLVIVASLVAFAFAALLLSIRQFSNEKNILK
jgi:sodium transport system permease protein